MSEEVLYNTDSFSLVTQILSDQGFNHVAFVHVRLSLDSDFFIMY